MKIVCIHVVLLVAIVSDITAGYTVQKHRETDVSMIGRQRRTDVPFNCDSYMYLLQHLKFGFTRDIFRKFNEVFEDNQMTKEDFNNLLPFICATLSNTSSLYDMRYAECSNANVIRESMEHIGPLCLRPGTPSTFAKNLLANFTKVTATRECNIQIWHISHGCRMYNSLDVPLSSYCEELDSVRRIIKKRFLCALDALNSAHACGIISDVKRAYLLLTFFRPPRPGLVYSMDDFFK